MNKQLSLSVLSFVVVACSQAPVYSQTVSEFQKLKNEGSVELVLDMFADRPSLHFGPLGTITGLDEIRGILEYDRALDAQLRFEDCVTAALEVSCRVVETNDWLRSVDIESITYDESKFTFTSDGRIQSVASALSVESGLLLGAAMAEFHVWATTYEPIEYAGLFSENGTFVYNYQNGERILALLRKWRTE